MSVQVLCPFFNGVVCLIYTMEFYAAERKKELIPFATAWMELESIMLSEISQAVREKYLISFLTHSLFNSMLFTLHDFECFRFFPLGLVSSFSPLWSKKMLDMISIFLNLLRLALCPIMWSIFENIPWTLEKNVYFASLG